MPGGLPREIKPGQIEQKEGTDMIGQHAILRLVGGFVALTALLTGCDSTPPVAELPPPPVTISQPVVRELVEQDEYEGHIGAAEKVEVRARVRGHLTKVSFEAGKMVKAGDLLYQIDPRPYENALEAARAQEKAADANLQFAKAEYNRTRGLLSKNAASREELEVWIAKQAVAAADLLKAEAAIKQAQLDLDFTTISAPIAGKMSRSLVDVGNLINAGGGETLLTTLVSVDPMYIYFNVDERSLLRYRASDPKKVKPDAPQPTLKELHIPIHVALEGELGYPHKGEIDFADNRINPSTGTIQVRGVLSVFR
jgi:RND family efflux transporter MFP subunit